MRGVVKAAALNKLHVLEWLFANTDARLWTQMVDDVAARKGHLEILLWVLPDLEAEFRGDTKDVISNLLLAAAKHGHLEVAKWLQERINVLHSRR